MTVNYENLSFEELVVKAANIAEVLDDSQSADWQLKLCRVWLQGVGIELMKRASRTTQEALQRKRILLRIEKMQADDSAEVLSSAVREATATPLAGRPSPQHASESLSQYPPPGSHLVTPRTLYVHHGLSLGDGWVIHRTGPGDAVNDGTVCRVTLEEFAGGRTWRARPHPNRRYSPSESIERGRSREGEVAYNVAFNNCEHFVNWCIEGEHRSEQVEQVFGGVKVVAQAALHHVKSPSPTAGRVPTTIKPPVTLPPVVPGMLEKASGSLLPTVFDSATRALSPLTLVPDAFDAASRLFDFLRGD